METKNMELMYQQIANTLVDMISEEWDKIYLYAEYREGYKKVFFYYYPENKSKPIYSLDIIDIFNIDEDDFDRLENELYTCFTNLWLEFSQQELDSWSHLTYILDSNGKMKINYGYDDLSEISPVEKQEKWESEYI
nr:immunity protein YezG family protein [Terribacillus saccharophilus]